jgi:hypothetical protein
MPVTFAREISRDDRQTLRSIVLDVFADDLEVHVRKGVHQPKEPHVTVFVGAPHLLAYHIHVKKGASGKWQGTHYSQSFLDRR